MRRLLVLLMLVGVTHADEMDRLREMQAKGRADLQRLQDQADQRERDYQTARDHAELMAQLRSMQAAQQRPLASEPMFIYVEPQPTVRPKTFEDIDRELGGPLISPEEFSRRRKATGGPR